MVVALPTPSPKYQVYAGVVPVLVLLKLNELLVKHWLALAIVKLATGAVHAPVTVIVCVTFELPQLLLTV